MKAAIITEKGLEIRDVPRPQPKPNEVLVKVRASGLNRADLLMSSGRMHGSTGGAGSSLGASVGSGSVHGDSYGVGGSADPRPGHDGDDKDLSRIRGSNIG